MTFLLRLFVNAINEKAMHSVFSFVILCLLSTKAFCATEEGREKHYNGYKVFRLLPNTLDQLQYLNGMVNDVSLIIPTKKIDFWIMPKDINSTVDLMVSPDMVKNIQKKLSSQNIKSKILIKDVGDILEQEKRDIEETSLLYRTKSWAQNESVFFTNYHSISEIHQYLDDLNGVDAKLSSVETIGTSSEGRPLKMIKIGTQIKDEKGVIKEKPIIWIDAGIHAREWIAPMTALFIANKLIRSDDNDVKELLSQFDFYILPSANPDGYEFSRDHDRMWRKTRSYNPSFWGLFCRGVDPNRNYDFHWSQTGSSSYPCSEIYHGPNAFSEPETRAISNYILKVKDRIKMYIAMHSYSQFILTPWGWTNELPQKYNDLLQRAEAGAQALKLRYGTQYRVGSSTRILYAAAGGADDWAHGVANIKYSYTFELRDTGDYGFILPTRFIIPSGEETFDALKVITSGIADELHLKKMNK